MEYDKKTGQWRIKACNNKYWSLQHAGGIQAVANNMYDCNSASISVLVKFCALL